MCLTMPVSHALWYAAVVVVTLRIVTSVLFGSVFER
jgi:hypothetical protein